MVIGLSWDLFLDQKNFIVVESFNFGVHRGQEGLSLCG